MTATTKELPTAIEVTAQKPAPPAPAPVNRFRKLERHPKFIADGKRLLADLGFTLDDATRKELSELQSEFERLEKIILENSHTSAVSEYKKRRASALDGTEANIDLLEPKADLVKSFRASSTVAKQARAQFVREKVQPAVLRVLDDVIPLLVDESGGRTTLEQEYAQTLQVPYEPSASLRALNSLLWSIEGQRLSGHIHGGPKSVLAHLIEL